MRKANAARLGKHLRKEWNLLYPDWAVSDRGNFAQRYGDVRITLLFRATRPGILNPPPRREKSREAAPATQKESDAERGRDLDADAT